MSIFAQRNSGILGLVTENDMVVGDQLHSPLLPWMWKVCVKRNDMTLNPIFQDGK
ncbi:MAG: hypothetical protein U0996_21850 [Planctomycetaceae bacterium]